MQSEQLKKELKEIAEILNQFKSEAVQLKVLDMLTSQLTPTGTPTASRGKKMHPHKRESHDKSMPEKMRQKPPEGKSGSRTSGRGAHSVIVRLLEDGFF